MADRAPTLNETLASLRATAEETRLRILALLAEGELSVSDLTDILGQSQPRISRHLKLLVEAGLVERHREGAWAFFRLAENGSAGRILQPILVALDPSDELISADRERLAAVRKHRAEVAQGFFARLAPEWDRLRSLQAPEDLVERAILDAIGSQPFRHVLDLGTGTGRMLELFRGRYTRGLGIDLLSIAELRVDIAIRVLHKRTAGHLGMAIEDAEKEDVPPAPGNVERHDKIDVPGPGREFGGGRVGQDSAASGLRVTSSAFAASGARRCITRE